MDTLYNKFFIVTIPRSVGRQYLHIQWVHICGQAWDVSPFHACLPRESKKEVDNTNRSFIDHRVKLGMPVPFPLCFFHFYTSLFLILGWVIDNFRAVSEHDLTPNGRRRFRCKVITICWQFCFRKHSSSFKTWKARSRI